MTPNGDKEVYFWVKKSGPPFINVTSSKKINVACSRLFLYDAYAQFYPTKSDRPLSEFSHIDKANEYLYRT
jgi:hypothetical protein